MNFMLLILHCGKGIIKYYFKKIGDIFLKRSIYIDNLSIATTKISIVAHLKNNRKPRYKKARD